MRLVLIWEKVADSNLVMPSKAIHDEWRKNRSLQGAEQARSDQFGIRRVYLLTRGHIEMFLLKHMLEKTSDHPVA